MIVTPRKRSTRIRHLTPGRSYWVFGIEGDFLRLLNDEGGPYLYQPQFFTVLDASEPADWVSVLGEEGERYAYPPELKKPGFFEDFFDAKPEAVAAFWQLVNGRLAGVA